MYEMYLYKYLKCLSGDAFQNDEILVDFKRRIDFQDLFIS